MGHKIFLSYKYADNNVQNISGNNYWESCTARAYANEIELELNSTNDIYKGESDGEDLSQLSDATIWEKLKSRIYDSTVTIVLMSKGMKSSFEYEKNQWIPQEISYSLRETPRKNKNGDNITSHTNALLAVVLPDQSGNYSYYTENKTCCATGCRTMNSQCNYIFNIMKGNLFNQKEPNCKVCDGGSTVYYDQPSYMHCVKWSDFKSDMSKFIEEACEIQANIENYNIQKTI